MNVGQLIEHLKQFDPDMKVVTTNESACFRYVGNTVPGFEVNDVNFVYLDNNDLFTRHVSTANNKFNIPAVLLI